MSKELKQLLKFAQLSKEKADDKYNKYKSVGMNVSAMEQIGRSNAFSELESKITEILKAEQHDPQGNLP